MSPSELATIVGLIFGPAGLITAYLSFRREPREARQADQTLVLSAGESGVQILNGANAALTGVVGVLQQQLDRAQTHLTHMEAAIEGRQEDLRKCADDRRRCQSYVQELDGYVRDLQTQLTACGMPFKEPPPREG